LRLAGIPGILCSRRSARDGQRGPGGRPGGAGAAGRAASVQCVSALAGLADAPAARSLPRPGNCGPVSMTAVVPAPVRHGLAFRASRFPAGLARQLPHSQFETCGEVRLPLPEQSAYICPVFPRLPCISHQPSSCSCLPCELSQPRAQCRCGRRDRLAIGEQSAPVLEQDDAIAQQAPALLEVIGRDSRGRAVRRVPVRARGQVLAHLSLRYRQLTLVAARSVAPGYLGERHVRAACHQRSCTSLARSSQQAANSSTC
jgi:hypothetical protein